MNVSNLMKQCELVIKLTGGATNAELDLVYNSAKQMVEDGMSKSNMLVIRDTPDEICLADVCTFLRNLRMWHFCVVADFETLYRWQQVTRICEITKVGNEYALKFKS